MRQRAEDRLDVLKIIQSEIKSVEKTLEEVDDFYRKDLRKLDRISDKISEIGGSWAFITTFLIVLFSWVILNAVILMVDAFDPYPFTLLNLVLSTVAAIQAPVILMSQNRAAKRDQARVEMDLEKDLRDLHVDQRSHELLLELKKDIMAIKHRLRIK